MFEFPLFGQIGFGTYHYRRFEEDKIGAIVAVVVVFWVLPIDPI